MWIDVTAVLGCDFFLRQAVPDCVASEAQLFRVWDRPGYGNESIRTFFEVAKYDD